MHACIADIHTYILTYVHTYIHTYVHTYMHTYMHKYIHTYMHTCIHTYIHTSCTVSYIRKCVHVSMNVCMYIRIQTSFTFSRGKVKVHIRFGGEFRHFLDTFFLTFRELYNPRVNPSTRWFGGFMRGSGWVGKGGLIARVGLGTETPFY